MNCLCKCKSYSHFYSKNISMYAIFNDHSFNDTLTDDIVSFEQLGPAILFTKENTFLTVCFKTPSERGAGSFLVQKKTRFKRKIQISDNVIFPECVSIPLKFEFLRDRNYLSISPVIVHFRVCLY